MKLKFLILALCMFPAKLLMAQQNSWTCSLGGNTALMYPVIDGNVLYAAGENVFAAIDIKNGKPLWTFKAEGIIAMPPLIANKTAFFTTKAGNVYALDLNLKKPKWTLNVGDKLICTPLIYKDLLIVYTKNFFIALDKEVGLDMWKTELKTSGSPLLKLSGDVLCFSDNMKITAISPANGKLLWTNSLPVFGQSDLLINNEKIYFTNADKLYCLNLADGREIWKKVMNSNASPLINTVPCIADNLLVVTCNQEVIAYTADKGQELWRVSLKTPASLHSPVICNNKIYVAEYGTKLFCLRIDKGKVEQIFEAPAKMESELLIENNRVYFFTSDGFAGSFYLVSEK
ncbi:MAG: PQQ-binding-like beta-propeller repeat protein [Sphingobacteriales bacterium]|nr:PQQ-binding-like beta-propeller repeat protein [Sphingobacteriales bacterium]